LLCSPASDEADVNQPDRATRCTRDVGVEACVASELALDAVSWAWLASLASGEADTQVAAASLSSQASADDRLDPNLAAATSVAQDIITVMRSHGLPAMRAAIDSPASRPIPPPAGPGSFPQPTPTASSWPSATP
jgi:hypothetical protein